MGRTIRQHYVPQSYLRRFSFDGIRLHTFLIKKDIPNILDNETLKKYLKNISVSDVCVEKDYYRLDSRNPNTPKGIDVDILERDFFSHYAEPKLCSTTDNLLKFANRIIVDNTPVASIRFSDTLRQDIALCAYIQYCRTPRQRHPIEAVNTVIKIHNKFYREENGVDYDHIPNGIDMAYNHADKTFMNPYLWRMFYTKVSSYCLLLRVSKNDNFLTSDNPVVIHKLGARGHEIFNVNFYRDEFSLFFPLTPNLLLEYYNPEAFPDAVLMNDTISLVDERYEEQVNKYQYINAEKFVFSRTNDFSLFLKPINIPQNNNE